MLYVMLCATLCHTVCHTVAVCNIMCHIVSLFHHSTDQKKYMEMCLALFDLISILEQQDSNPILLGEAFAAITCLTDISMSLSPGQLYHCVLCYDPCRTTTQGGMSSAHLYQSVRGSF